MDGTGTAPGIILAPTTLVGLAELEHHVQDLEHRVATVEQILPTLATKADIADLTAAIAPLTTKAEVKADIQRAVEETCRHFDIVGEGLRAELRMVADRVVRLCASVDAHSAEIASVLGNHESRLTRLETWRPKRW